MAALTINWVTVSKIVKPVATLTGDTAEEIEKKQEISLFDQLQKPTVVFVEGGGADFDLDKLEEIVFKNEKVGLGMKAFNAVKISPQEAQEDALIADKGRTLPRILVIDPAKEKIRVLEAKKIKPGALYNAMKSVAGSFYKESLDKVVKAHQKILGEQDRLYGEEKTLNEKVARLKKDGDKAAKKLKGIEKELEELAALARKLKEEQDQMWKLTPKHGPKA